MEKSCSVLSFSSFYFDWCLCCEYILNTKSAGVPLVCSILVLKYNKKWNPVPKKSESINMNCYEKIDCCCDETATEIEHEKKWKSARTKCQRHCEQWISNETPPFCITKEHKSQHWTAFALKTNCRINGAECLRCAQQTHCIRCTKLKFIRFSLKSGLIMLNKEAHLCQFFSNKYIVFN